MRNTGHEMQDTRCKNGFTIIELLIALAITSILLAAVAVAFNASIINYSENEDMFKAINSARQALFRITTQLRTATAVDPNSTADSCTFITADGNDITYQYNSTENKLYLITNDDLSDSDYVLCNNVAAMTFSKTTGIKDAVIYVKSVHISMTVSSGGVQQTVSSAAVIRRNL